jgi:hypothetical protein
MAMNRGKQISKAIPVRGLELDISNHLLSLERAGLARISRNSLSTDFWNLPRPQDPQGRSLQFLIEERKISS